MKPFQLKVFILLLLLLSVAASAQHSKKFNPTENLIKAKKIRQISPVILDSIVNVSVDSWNCQTLIFNYDKFGRLNYYDQHGHISGRNTYDYDSLGNLICQSFVNSRRTYTYDSLNNNISQLFERPGVSQQWVPWSFDTLIYDKNGTLINIIEMNWYGMWGNADKTTYYYKNGVMDSISFEAWDGSQWTNYLYGKLHNNNLGQTDTVVWKLWNTKLWFDYLNCSYNYDQSGNLISGLTEDLDGMIADSRFFYNYNEDNNFIYGKNEIKLNGDWVPGDEPFYSSRMDIFEPSLISTWSEYLFNLSTSGTELFVYYKINPAAQSVLDNNNINLNSYSLLQNYPNPFNPSTTIKFTIPSDGLVKIQVYDILGREMAILVNEYRHKGNYEVKYDAGNLPSGIYIYRINCGIFTQSKKMVLQK